MLVSTAVVSVRKHWPLAMPSALARVTTWACRACGPFGSQQSEEP